MPWEYRSLHAAPVPACGTRRLRALHTPLPSQGRRRWPPLGQGLGVPGGILASVKLSPGLPFSPIHPCSYAHKGRRGRCGEPCSGRHRRGQWPFCLCAHCPGVPGPPPHSGSLRAGPHPLALMVWSVLSIPPPLCAGPQPPPPSAGQPPPETPQQTHLQSCPAPKTTP